MRNRVLYLISDVKQIEEDHSVVDKLVLGSLLAIEYVRRCVPLKHTGWSRKIETVKFGCIRSRGRIGFKIYACKIRLIISQ